MAPDTSKWTIRPAFRLVSEESSTPSRTESSTTPGACWRMLPPWFGSRRSTTRRPCGPRPHDPLDLVPNNVHPFTIGTWPKRSVPRLSWIDACYIVIFNQLGGYYESSSRRFTFSKDADFALVKKLKE